MSHLHPLVGVACMFLVVAIKQGCSKSDNKTAGKPAGEKHAEHAHPEVGPHKGKLIELGKEEYHAELVHDDATRKVTINLLDGEARCRSPCPTRNSA